MMARPCTITPSNRTRRRTRSRTEEDGLQNPLEENVIEENRTFTPADLLLFQKEQQEDDLRILPFGPVFEKIEEAGTAVTQAHNLAGYQAVGVRCREALLELIGVAQDAAAWTDTPPQRANFRAWAEIICNDLLPGDTNKERRGALKGALEAAWTFSNWLTHSKSATWIDADMAHSLNQHASGMATSLILRELRPAWLAQCIGSGAKLNQTTSVRTWAWVVTCTATRRQSDSISSYRAEGCPETITWHAKLLSRARRVAWSASVYS